MKFLLKALILILLSQSLLAAKPIFQNKADDLTVDDRCELYKPSSFLKKQISYFIVSTKGSTRVGFDEEIPLTRSEARTLWGALNPNARKGRRDKSLRAIEKSEKLKEFYNVLLDGKRDRAADYYSEGEVLEVLSYEYLPESDFLTEILEDHFGGVAYSEDDFFITGGVTYHGRNGRTIGELDIIVGDSSTCTIFAIGEAKLGGKKNKAREQLRRIQSFLRKL